MYENNGKYNYMDKNHAFFLEKAMKLNLSSLTLANYFGKN